MKVLRNLRELVLDHTKVTQTPGSLISKPLLGSLLSLSYVQVTDAGMIHLKGLTELEVLVLCSPGAH